MSIAEKLKKIAENTPKVYEGGKNYARGNWGGKATHGYIANADGTYTISTLALKNNLDWTAGQYIDIAYVAFVENLDSLSGFVTEDTYTLLSPDADRIVSNRFAEKEPAESNVVYLGADCFAKTNVNLKSSIETENGMSYAHCVVAPQKTAWNIFLNGASSESQNLNVGKARYVVIKRRDNRGDTAVRFSIGTNTATGRLAISYKTNTGGKWVVYVIDLLAHINRISNVYNKGVLDGIQAEYDRFWDNFQDYGSRTNYFYAFANWSLEEFTPKYDIAPVNLEGIFMMSNMAVDLPAYLEEIGINIDFKNATNSASMTNTFRGCKFTRIGEINSTMSENFNHTFGNSLNLRTIDKLVLREDGSQGFSSSTFINCLSLENLVIEGVIGKNGFNVQWSTKLSQDSIVSIINALSPTTSGLTVTLSKTAVNNAFETSGGTADGPTSAEWLALIATRSNWTISLV